MRRPMGLEQSELRGGGGWWEGMQQVVQGLEGPQAGLGFLPQGRWEPWREVTEVCICHSHI